MGKKGVEVVCNADIAKVEKTEKGLCAAMLDGTERYADVILYAIGRDPLTAELGLAEAGVDLAENGAVRVDEYRSEEHTSELQSLMRISYAVFCLKKKIKKCKSHNTVTHDVTSR